MGEWVSNILYILQHFHKGTDNMIIVDQLSQWRWSRSAFQVSNRPVDPILGSNTQCEYEHSTM